MVEWRYDEENAPNDREFLGAGMSTDSRGCRLWYAGEVKYCNYLKVFIPTGNYITPGTWISIGQWAELEDEKGD